MVPHGDWRKHRNKTAALARHLEALAKDGRLAEFVENIDEAARFWSMRWPFAGSIPYYPAGSLTGEQTEWLRSELDQRVQAAWPQHGVETGDLRYLLKMYPTLLAGPSSVGIAYEHLARSGTNWFLADPGETEVSIELLLSQDQPIPVDVVTATRRLGAGSNYWPPASELAKRLEGPVLNPGEAWSDAVLDFLETAEPRWRELLDHAGKATSAKPAARWVKQARQLIAELGDQTVEETMVSWLAEVGKPRTIVVDIYPSFPHCNEVFDPYNANYLRGLLWMLGLLDPDDKGVRSLARLVDVSLRKIPEYGVRSQLIANAAIYALSTIDDPAAVGQIARLAASVKSKPTLKSLHKALDARAIALGISRDEVEELAVPDYGLTEVGVGQGGLGDARWEITVEADGTKLLWRNASGKTLKSPPAAVKREYAEELKELKVRIKDIAKMVTAQTERLDRQFLAQREWRYPAWRERYLDHPLVGTVARRLIWSVDGTACAFADGELRDVHGSVVKSEAETANVELWHPIGREVEEVLAWREFLECHNVVQPFKQAHREVYLLTAAEENTRVYSNRFAAHILKQHQYNALARARGWDNALRLMVDDSYEPTTKYLPQWNLRAEYWVEGIGDNYSVDTTEAGTYLRLATDQVRFYRENAPRNLARLGAGGYEQQVHERDDAHELVPLAEIPPLVLSEVLRDVDLFVGVASVGNDPEWSDGGAEGRFRDYWHSYSFGDLGATAITRKNLLERLVPRLAIAERAEIDGKFLRVRGDLRTYRIHLGSGNILMEPDNEYLCIVPKQAAGGDAKVFLPFDGDRVLALILSKALLLAKDTTITDSAITSQISRRPSSR